MSEKDITFLESILKDLIFSQLRDKYEKEELNLAGISMLVQLSQEGLDNTKIDLDIASLSDLIGRLKGAGGLGDEYLDLEEIPRRPQGAE